MCLFGIDVSPHVGQSAVKNTVATPLFTHNPRVTATLWFICAQTPRVVLWKSIPAESSRSIRRLLEFSNGGGQACRGMSLFQASVNRRARRVGAPSYSFYGNYYLDNYCRGNMLQAWIT